MLAQNTLQINAKSRLNSNLALLREIANNYQVNLMNDSFNLVLLDEVFTPSRPVMNRDFFFGRIDQINKILESISAKWKTYCTLWGAWCWKDFFS